MIKSIIPVLLKCKPNNTDVDIEIVKYDLREIFNYHIGLELKRIGINDKNLIEMKYQDLFKNNGADVNAMLLNQGIDSDLHSDLFSQIQDIKQKQSCYHEFAERTIIFDPLDRPIPDSDNDYGTKRDAFVELIENTSSVNGKLINVPMTNLIYENL